jgi:Ca2+-binding RTX toxin-like protein
VATNDSLNPATSGDDTLSGTSSSDTLTGGAGNDTITGSGGADYLRGDGGVEGSWHYETFDRDFTTSAGQAFDIELGTRTGSGYVTDFDEGALTNTIRNSSGVVEDFGVVYTSTLNTVAGGTYRLTTTSDDGSTIQIFDSSGTALSFSNETGGTLDYLNNDFHQGSTTRFGDVTLDPGETYSVQIRYWENLGGDVLEATISGPDTSNVAQDLLTSPMVGVPPGPEYTVTGLAPLQDGNDSLLGGGGNDTLIGDGGDDTLAGGGASDLVDGGTGADSLLGGGGTDTLIGGSGNDTLRGGNSADLLQGGDDADRLLGGAGADTLEGQDGNDFLNGNDGDDRLLGGAGNDQLIGDTGTVSNDKLIYSSDFEGAGTAAGWSNASTDSGGSFSEFLGRFGLVDGTVASEQTFDVSDPGTYTIVEFQLNLLDSWDGESFVLTLNGNTFSFSHTFNQPVSSSIQTLTGAGGETYEVELSPNAQGALGFSGWQDAIADIRVEATGLTTDLTVGVGSTLNQGISDESFGIDNFSVFKSDDAATTLGTLITSDPGNNDTLIGGTGDDTLRGGVGFDRFIYTAGDGDDVISDFNTGTGQDFEDGDQSNNDFIDLSAFYTNLFELRADLADNNVADQSVGDYSDNTSMAGGSLRFTGVSSADLTEDNVNLACFVAGTLIETQQGAVPVEDLREGQLVMTLDRGFQPLRRLLKSTVSGLGKFAPVVFSKGALGGDAELSVSPMHRMFVSDWRAEMLFGDVEVLVPAVHLVNADTIYRRPVAQVTYVHILFDAHEIVLAHGIPSESFHPNLKSVGADETRSELLEIFPNLALQSPIPTARRILKGYESAILSHS